MELQVKSCILVLIFLVVNSRNHDYFVFCTPHLHFVPITALFLFLNTELTGNQGTIVIIMFVSCIFHIY